MFQCWTYFQHDKEAVVHYMFKFNLNFNCVEIISTDSVVAFDGAEENEQKPY